MLTQIKKNRISAILAGNHLGSIKTEVLEKHISTTCALCLSIYNAHTVSPNVCLFIEFSCCGCP